MERDAAGGFFIFHIGSSDHTITLWLFEMTILDHFGLPGGRGGAKLGGGPMFISGMSPLRESFLSLGIFS